ncbi:hypothetical protein DY000_02047306 [Brassica cretica]|uniref:Uncharacterized protein n=1 Tax=Brassica cretica TaxID=69181 RepID=A0ABQ7ER61_BRACR|nr:hypothetical protein DY000_02047306 [Brassica cretica]
MGVFLLFIPLCFHLLLGDLFIPTAFLVVLSLDPCPVSPSLKRRSASGTGSASFRVMAQCVYGLIAAVTTVLLCLPQCLEEVRLFFLCHGNFRGSLYLEDMLSLQRRRVSLLEVVFKHILGRVEASFHFLCLWTAVGSGVLVMIMSIEDFTGYKMS